MGFGLTDVSSAILVPRPPAKMTTFIRTSSVRDHTSSGPDHSLQQQPLSALRLGSHPLSLVELDQACNRRLKQFRRVAARRALSSDRRSRTQGTEPSFPVNLQLVAVSM